jgi:hypothetical protein
MLVPGVSCSKYRKWGRGGLQERKNATEKRQRGITKEIDNVKRKFMEMLIKYGRGVSVGSKFTDFAFHGGKNPFLEQGNFMTCESGKLQ